MKALHGIIIGAVAPVTWSLRASDSAIIMKALHGIIIGAVAALLPALATGGKKMAIEFEEESSSSPSTSHSSPKQPSSPDASNSIIKNSVVATGPDLINEMKALHTSL